MSTITIYLKADPEGNLYLRDSEGNTGKNDLTTHVKRRDIILWKLESDSGIKHIINIAAKHDSENVFKKKGPRKKLCSKKWHGTIADKIGKEEVYFIEFLMSDGKKINTDPRIIVKPDFP